MKIDSKLKTQNSRLACHGQSGYIALFSSIILGAIFVLLFTGMFRLAVGGMERISDKENAQKANSLAINCTEYALSQIREDPDYPGDEAHPTELCSVGSVGIYGDNRSFNTQGDHEDHTKQLSIEVKILEEEGERTLEIVEWRYAD